MSLTGRDGGTYKPAQAVYGRSGGSWLYAKVAWAYRDGQWRRAWTDCRQHDAGGRDWSSSSSTSTVTCADCSGCGTSTKQVTTVTYTKEGCPTYTRTSETGCTSCGSWTASTGDFVENGIDYFYVGPAGYYEVSTLVSPSAPGCADCANPGGCWRSATYYVENCSVGGRRGTTSPLSCGSCQDVFGNPC